MSAATLYSWRRSYGGMDTDAATALTELREQNARLKRSLAEAELAAMCLIVPSSPILGPQDSETAGLIHRGTDECEPTGRTRRASRVGRTEGVLPQRHIH